MFRHAPKLFHKLAGKSEIRNRGVSGATAPTRDGCE